MATQNASGRDVSVAEISAPLVSSALLWRSTYSTLSDELLHVPFFFWLVDAVRPECLVEVGLKSGVAYFSYCQAADHLEIGTRCHGLGTHAAEDKDAFAELLEHNRQHYPDFSQISEGEIGRFAERFANGTINLLHLSADIPGGIEAALHGPFASKLAEDAVIVLHGVAALLKDTAGRQMIAALSDGCRSMTFDHGSGLLILLRGTAGSERLDRLHAAQEAPRERAQVTRLFTRLGSALFYETENRALLQKVEWQRSKLTAAEKTLQKAEEKTAGLETEARASMAELADLQSRLFDAASALEGQRAALEQEEARRERAEAAAAEAVSAIDAERAEKETLKTELTEARGQLDRTAETLRDLQADHDRKTAAHGETEEALRAELAEQAARLTAMETAAREYTRAMAAAKQKTEALEAQLASARAETEKRIAAYDRSMLAKTAALSVLEERAADLQRQLTEEADRTGEALEQLVRERDEARQLNDALHDSTSWKITAPARHLSLLLRRG